MKPPVSTVWKMECERDKNMGKRIATSKAASEKTKTREGRSDEHFRLPVELKEMMRIFFNCQKCISTEKGDHSDGKWKIRKL